MVEEGRHAQIADGLMRAALSELARAGQSEPATHLHRAIEALAPAIGRGCTLSPDLAVLVAAIPLDAPQR